MTLAPSHTAHDSPYRPGDRPTTTSEALLLEQVHQAMAEKKPLSIQGGNTKSFLGRPVEAPVICTKSHSGIVSYDPTELVVTVRAGTLLSELETILDEKGQMLAFEPPHFGEQATVGGMVATGLAGPRRPWSGSVRDFVLGTKVITGQGKLLRFGGEVMKNVAGYDVSRLMVGSYGCLGLITEVSMKVLPKPKHQQHLSLKLPQRDALAYLEKWGQASLPLTAACFFNDTLYLRLEGGDSSVKTFANQLNGSEIDPNFWVSLKEQQLPFFKDSGLLWRCSVPSQSPVLDLPGEQILDWGGAQRWLKTSQSPEAIRTAVAKLGGHATSFTPGITTTPFHPLPNLLMRYHQRLKAKLDPSQLFNPGRMYSDY
ncbi:glycolate oxidase subunit GlcE [Nitrincola tibetensis]|uniref:Glycolate oxidase subunit GlcE n=1 Tax=Nitrincola tibetensis TaxID=2219697 RepID=A0A364NL79_9GAMM|nr:glycolate oxidase subunit GlcE [Nitrincola tibetensis]RAU17868.1 glycolate oxidase subunit GlcE [Nitrincola tibetensis]